jgi:hypothetical protein
MVMKLLELVVWSIIITPAIILFIGWLDRP